MFINSQYNKKKKKNYEFVIKNINISEKGTSIKLCN